MDVWWNVFKRLVVRFCMCPGGCLPLCWPSSDITFSACSLHSHGCLVACGQLVGCEVLNYVLHVPCTLMNVWWHVVNWLVVTF